MDKNRITGLPDRTSEQVIAKSATIKGRGGKSGGRAAKAVDLTSGGLRCCPGNGTAGVARRPDRNAGVSRGHSSRAAGKGLNGGRGK